MKTYSFILVILIAISVACQNQQSEKESNENLLMDTPIHGFVSKLQAAKWEESLVTGNGTFGALVIGDPFNERIILSHERLFMPEWPPTEAPNLGKRMGEIRKLVLDGKGQEASRIAIEEGLKAGVDEVWTNPLIPACQIEIEFTKDSMINYTRAVNYETGEAIVTWVTKEGTFTRKTFFSRPDGIGVTKIIPPKGKKLNFKIRLAELPSEDFDTEDLIESVQVIHKDNGEMGYTTEFKKKWEGSLKGYHVDGRVRLNKGSLKEENGCLVIEGAKEVIVYNAVELSFDMPIKSETGIDAFTELKYDELLAKHAAVHGEMFNRFSLKIGESEKQGMTAEELLNSSSYGNLNNQLLNQICEAARYLLISSTGYLPPALQGIWGGTWRPNWSGDFTQNGNVPSSIASGFNTNFIEVMDAYNSYMFSMLDDFKQNAKDVYGIEGVFCLSRSSSFGRTYHYIEPYPHLFWYAGAAWSSQFFFDYWQYTGNETFLKEKAIPFMLEALKFYQNIIYQDKDENLMFVPSYSPEVGPPGYHEVAINATMDVAALRQLLRNILLLIDLELIDSKYKAECEHFLNKLPEYAIDESGELKEWIWPGYRNNNEHRHASHLYPLFYEIDPAFKNPELREAAIKAIESRMQYRRGDNGAEMAFGLVQKGLAAAHIMDTAHAYECVDYLCNSYWSPAFTAYHDPGEIFNTDICGGLPAVVTEMLIQSSKDEIVLLPVLPEQWADGTIKGVRTRGGFEIEMKWKNSKPVEVIVKSILGNKSTLKFKNKVYDIDIMEGESKSFIF